MKMSEDEKTVVTNPEAMDAHLDCVRKQDEILKKLDEHDVAIKRIERTHKVIATELKGIHASQVEINKLVVALHAMWTRLDCVRGTRKTPSTEVLAVAEDLKEG